MSIGSHFARSAATLSRAAETVTLRASQSVVRGATNRKVQEFAPKVISKAQSAFKSEAKKSWKDLRSHIKDYTRDKDFWRGVGETFIEEGAGSSIKKGFLDVASEGLSHLVVTRLTARVAQGVLRAASKSSNPAMRKMALSTEQMMQNRFAKKLLEKLREGAKELVKEKAKEELENALNDLLDSLTQEPEFAQAIEAELDRVDDLSELTDESLDVGADDFSEELTDEDVGDESSEDPDEKERAESSSGALLLGRVESAAPSLPGLTQAGKVLKNLGTSRGQVFEFIRSSTPTQELPKLLFQASLLPSSLIYDLTDFESCDSAFEKKDKSEEIREAESANHGTLQKLDLEPDSESEDVLEESRHEALIEDVENASLLSQARLTSKFFFSPSLTAGKATLAALAAVESARPVLMNRPPTTLA